MPAPAPENAVASTEPGGSRRRERLAVIAATSLPAAASLLFIAARLRPEAPLATWLAPAILLEAIVVHAGALLGVALFAWPGTRRGHLLYWPLLAAFAALYMLAAFRVGGGATALQFVLLALVTYGGVLWAPAGHRSAVGFETALRWLIAVVAITLTFGLAGAPSSIAEWQDVDSRLTAGAVYFALLAAVEATGLYAAVRRIGAAAAGRYGHRPGPR
jgi:hypothetical protein